MRKCCVLIALLCVICCLCACTNSVRVQGEKLPDFDLLFVNSLPQEINNSLCKDLYVNRGKSLLGDPNYVVSCLLQFDNEESFQKHLKQIDTNGKAPLMNGGEEIYPIQWSEQNYQEYINDEMLDGYCAVYEIVAVNSDTREVRYLFAYVWDYWKGEHLISLLNELCVI